VCTTTSIAGQPIRPFTVVPFIPLDNPVVRLDISGRRPVIDVSTVPRNTIRIDRLLFQKPRVAFETLDHSAMTIRQRRFEFEPRRRFRFSAVSPRRFYRKTTRVSSTRSAGACVPRLIEWFPSNLTLGRAYVVFPFNSRARHKRDGFPRPPVRFIVNGPSSIARRRKYAPSIYKYIYISITMFGDRPRNDRDVRARSTGRPTDRYRPTAAPTRRNGIACSTRYSDHVRGPALLQVLNKSSPVRVRQTTKFSPTTFPPLP